MSYVPHRFTNRGDIDFTNASELPAQQKLELVEDLTAMVDYPLQYVVRITLPRSAKCAYAPRELPSRFLLRRIRKFQGVSSITLFVEDNFGGDDSRIYYIGLKGESKKVTSKLSCI